MTGRADFGARAGRLHPELVYQRELATERITEERQAVLTRLAGRKRVLEIGAASGFFSELLREQGHDVTAVEGDPRAAERARAIGVSVVEGDAESNAVWEDLRGRYDAVLFMHVLEHLIDPWLALRRARERLNEGGGVISLLPNVASWRPRKDLFFCGRFRYEDTGILDRTHLRFFTLHSALELHRAAGFEDVSWTPIDVCVPVERRIRVQLGLRSVADSWHNWMVGRFPNLCSEIILFEATT